MVQSVVANRADFRIRGTQQVKRSLHDIVAASPCDSLD
jgi:hypothetical protein